MREIESRIIELIDKKRFMTWSAEYSDLLSEPFGSMTLEFFNHPTFQDYIQKSDPDGFHYKLLRLLVKINDYLFNKNNFDLAAALKLSIAKQAFGEFFKDMTRENKERGTAVFPPEFLKHEFVKRLYGSGDEKLISAFMMYLPKPRSYVFASNPIPDDIAKTEKESAQFIKNVLTRNREDFDAVEKQVMKLQRVFRAKRKARENTARITHYYQISKNEARNLFEEANKVYKPNCEESLAIRIINAVKNMELFNEVKHYTSPDSIKSIMNNGLYGRHTLAQFYIPFSPSALQQCDIQQGDLNVVCFGANMIDDRAKHRLHLHFDANKIAKKNPCVFFKQRDLGFKVSQNRTVTIGELELVFNHTQPTPDAFRTNQTSLLLFCNADVYASASLKNALVISNNMNKIHQILTLNFFRFIDKLIVNDDHYVANDKKYPTASEIYSALSKLDDLSLKEKLKEIGMKMSDTMEYNIYGAYQIDFDALKRIEERGNTIKLPEFIDEINNNDTKVLKEAMEHFPTLFASYRFMDYLIKHVNDEPSKKLLQACREQCETPSYLSNKI